MTAAKACPLGRRVIILPKEEDAPRGETVIHNDHVHQHYCPFTRNNHMTELCSETTYYDHQQACVQAYSHRNRTHLTTGKY